MREQLFDRLRRRLVADVPEERIRQSVIEWMLDAGQYPESMLCVEKQLMCFEGSASSSEGHKIGNRTPLRRFDLLCMRLFQGRLEPLLLIECKATRASEKVKKQVLDYNYHVGAPFAALACADLCAFTSLLQTPLEQEGSPHWQLGLPTHAALQQWLSQT